jgi:hypothetical protein
MIDLLGDGRSWALLSDDSTERHQCQKPLGFGQSLPEVF